MTQTTAVWLVVLMALCGANLPFVNQRLLAIWPLKGDKPLPVRLVELLLFYLVTGAVALLLEQRLGQVVPQGWEFYAITGALFLTLAFPGFVYRYLLRHRD